MNAVRLILGPQRPAINLRDACDAAGLPQDQFAVLSAGWKEAEGDIDDVREVLGRPLEDLALYYRAESIFAANPELAAAFRSRQDRLKGQQRLYRLRLRQLAVAARKLLKADGDADMLAAEQQHAIAQLRALDQHHLERTEAINAAFNHEFSIESFPDLMRHRDAVRQVLSRCSGIVITGGNIAIILNRMRMFGVDRLLDDKHVVAWSGGAMVLAQRIVLFHDYAPHGRRDPEIFGAGCGLLPGYVFLPDAADRLREKDRARMGLLSQRFAPDTCIVLDNGAALSIGDDTVTAASSVRRIDESGRFARFRAA